MIKKIEDAIIENPKKSDYEIAVILYRKLKKSEVLKIIEECVRNSRRMEVRENEKRTFDKIVEKFEGRSFDIEDDGMVASCGMVELLKEKFRTWGEESVEWGKATVEQHQAYIDMIRSQIIGAERTVRFHEKAIQEIQKHHVTCLNEIPKKELALV